MNHKKIKSNITSYKKKIIELEKVNLLFDKLNKDFDKLNYVQKSKFISGSKLFFNKNLKLYYKITKHHYNGVKICLYYIKNNCRIYYRSIDGFYVIGNNFWEVDKINYNFGFINLIEDEDLKNKIVNDIVKFYLFNFKNSIPNFTKRNSKNKYFIYFQKYINLL